MKGYMSAQEASCKCRESESRVRRLCQAGRIPGPERFGRSRTIHSDAAKPGDPRRTRRTETQGFPRNTEVVHL